MSKISISNLLDCMNDNYFYFYIIIKSFNFLFLFIEKNLLSSNFYLIDKLLYK